MGKGHRLWWYCPGLQAHIKKLFGPIQYQNNNNNNKPQPTMSRLPHQGSAQGSRPTQPNRKNEPDRKERQRNMEHCMQKVFFLLVALTNQSTSDSCECRGLVHQRFCCFEFVEIGAVDMACPLLPGCRGEFPGSSFVWCALGGI